MFKRILVPLDGSERAERAIPVAVRIARATDGSIVLLQAVEQATEYDMHPVRATIVTTQEVEANVVNATHYLTSVMQRDELEGIGIQIEVLIGDAAPTICSFAQSTTADLIVMCSHGYTGLKRWLLGSVADNITRTAPVPVLVLRDGGPYIENTSQNGSPVQALVSVDGSPLSEEIIEPVAHLIASLAAPEQGALHLTRIVDVPTVYGHGKSQANISLEMIEHAKQTASTYLTSLIENMQTGSLASLNLSLTSSTTVSNDIASAIIEAAEDTGSQYSLLAMSTHGRSGWKRWVMGSVTQRILHSTKLPLFIVRPRRSEEKKEGNQTQANTSAGGPQGEQSWVGLL